VLKYLFHKKDLGIHTELFSDGVIELVEMGILTGSRKTIHPGKMIAGFILGSSRLYDWVDDNPLIELHPTEYVNDPFVIAQNDKQVAVNSALEVDLTGQVCADSIGPKIYSGVGGQLDFSTERHARKAACRLSPWHKLGCARPCNSRIVHMLNRGAGVVTSRNHIHYVVTEFGVADLYAKSIRRRAQQLINIAHPDFREELTQQAKELHYL
jgi:acetyl-CoA hydrolase